MEYRRRKLNLRKGQARPCGSCLKDPRPWSFDGADSAYNAENSPRELLLLTFSLKSIRDDSAELRLLTTDARGKFVLRFGCRVSEAVASTKSQLLDFCFHRKQLLRFEIRSGVNVLTGALECDIAEILMTGEGTLSISHAQLGGSVEGTCLDRSPVRIEYSISEIPASKKHLLLKLCAVNLKQDGMLFLYLFTKNCLSYCRDQAFDQILPSLARKLLRVLGVEDGHRVRSTEWRRSRNPSWPLISVPLSELLPVSITFSNPRTAEQSHLDLLDGYARKIRILLLCHGPVGMFRPHPQICAHLTTEVGELFDCPLPGESGGRRAGRRSRAVGVAGDDTKPHIIVESCGVRLTRTFFDYLSVGVRICPLYCVDFSHYNGSRSNPFSLHYTDGSWPSVYEVTLVALADVLRRYSNGGASRLFGYGVGEREFCVDFASGPGVCLGVEGVVRSYRECSAQVAQLGTPLLAPAIRRCLKVISDDRSHLSPGSRHDGLGSSSGGCNYYIIVVLTAGVVADFRECVNALKQISALPVSVKMVMMGSGYCKQLYALRDAVLFPISASGSLSSQAANSLRRTVEPVARKCRLMQRPTPVEGPCRIGVVHFRDTFLLRGGGSREHGARASSNSSGRPFDPRDDRGGDDSGSGSGGEGSEPDADFVILNDDAYANRLTKLILGDIPARVTQFFSSHFDEPADPSP